MHAVASAKEHHMRYAALIFTLVALIGPARAAVASQIDPRASLGVVQQWIYNYRAKPDYAHVPAAVRVLFHSQTFKEPENAGIYIGFIAGAIGSNPPKAEQLVNSLIPVPPEDEWVIVRAIAYSGLPDWRNLLRRIAPKMPERRVMIDSYLNGTLPTLAEIPLEESKPGMLDKLRSAFSRNPFKKEDKKLDTKLTFATSQDLLDTLWGYYFATGSHVPIMTIVQMLPWSKSRDTIDKLTVGSMARYTLASYAVRDNALREFLRGELAQQPEAMKGPLTEVIRAADTVQLSALRRDAVAAVEELKTKGSDARRNLDFWGQVGVGALALGCVSAAALGEVAVGVPCVIGGATSQGLLSFWEKQQ
ncbi:hypothetical protein MTX26_15005 [Bradyrhizobium sp. ISRA443]|uniref:hypothetical protein n=1 Tax=unclassified Bradyrhizobium TaxID=2631580 RepID=UPI002478B4A3|nr:MULTISPECIES: hypothetical protein [unclassified Bradyrhizobium]WGR91705.1 hypothetical protein MTX20_25535 [Bradyrhizobium sp. ISRA435]WGS02042.1 hypothetical protein MTX23_15015 [Bradyrhizobium sp. ISRA436]WGS08927.1 hypothetical protein MTX18_15005 [Bradyrhizobium sp. ISRA437]WGS15816.1 hypothetical protein MTX26_15005 [Bradyrhizobium sp. ISRA443]